MAQKKLTKDELSLLLYFETRAVDHMGLIDTQHMNQDDLAIAKKWDEEKFASFNRWTQRNSDGSIKALTHRSVLSDEAWTLAHQERKARAERMSKKL